MTRIPDKDTQIIQVHAELINQVVAACHNPERASELEPALAASEANGWTELVNAIRGILTGRRDEQLLTDLDEEDRAIVSAILQGLQDPHSLPDPQAAPDATQAAPGLAHMIHAAARGDAQALHILGEMSEQMRQAGGDLTRVGGVLRRMVDGERDPAVLAQGMGEHGRSLIESIVEELARLQQH